MTIKQIRQLIAQDKDLKTITESYTEIAAIKMRKIRSGIERNRTFFNEISVLYQTVKTIANENKISLTARPKQSLAVAISSNFPFYGSIEHPVVNKFLQSKEVDKVVIGRTAVSYIKNINPNFNFQPIILKKDLPDQAELKYLRDLFISYNQVVLYFSKMISPFRHQPQAFNISENSATVNQKDHIDYILEPEIEQMIYFFDSEIGSSLLYQSFLEAELSRTAGRLISMDEASTKTSEAIKADTKKLGTAAKSDRDKKLLDMLASLKGHTHGL